MSAISISRKHNLGRDECHRLALELVQDLVASQGGSSKATGYEIRYSHISGSKGTIRSEETSLSINIKLGLLMSAMKRPIEAELNRLCDQYIE